MNKFDTIMKISKNIFPPETMVVTREFQTGSGHKCVLFFSDGMVDKVGIQDFVIRPLTMCKTEPTKADVASKIIEFCDYKSGGNFFEFVSPVFGGEALLVIQGVGAVFSLNTRFWPTRGVQEPPTDMVIKGSREGFNEDFQTCITLLKRRLKSPNLKFEAMKIGRISQTNVALCYIDKIANSEIISAVRTKLQQIDIDGVVDSSTIASFLRGGQNSIAREVGDTEKPDILASRLLEGRVGVIVDGCPIVLTLPYVFLEDLQAPQDYYEVPFSGTFSRALRTLALLVSLLSPAIYVASQIFHNQFVPLSFLLRIADSTNGLPLSPPLEMLLCLFVFEILNEASLRMPKYVGMALSVVGALVLGDTAVQAGIISTPTILIVAISGIAAYTLPNQQKTLSILRLCFLLVGGTFGIVGIFCLAVSLACYLASLSSFGVAYFAPFAPFASPDSQDGINKDPETIYKKRPSIFKSKNITRKK